MTITAILDILADLGGATVHSVWVPILAWTVLVIPLWSLVRRTDRLHPLAEYRLSQTLLASLPLGILAAIVADVLAIAPVSRPLVELQSVSSPLYDPAAGPGGNTGAEAALTTFVWHWTQALGAATVIALSVATFRLGKLVLQFAAALRVRTGVRDRGRSRITEEANRLARERGIGRPFRVRTSSDAAVPLTVGGLPPTIILPAGLIDRPEALRMTLHHELVHVRRWDDVAHLVERVVASVFAVLPSVHWLQRSIARCREQACDAAVLGDETTCPSAYAHLLVSLADRTVSAPVVVSLSESPSDLEQRLDAMKRSASFLSARWTSVLALVALITVTLGIVACSDGIAPTPPEQSETSRHSISVPVLTGERSRYTLNGEPVSGNILGETMQKVEKRGDPLEVVNGTPRAAVEHMDPVTSIEVLTGSAATDAYGERGVDGVIQYTTIPPPTGDPLVVLDGKPQARSRLSDLDPDDISSIEVIKGSAAVSAYGEQAANGVVKITTE